MPTDSLVAQDGTGLVVLLLVAFVLPTLVDLVTKKESNKALKSWLLLVLNLLNGLVVSFVTAHNAGQNFDWKGAVTAVVASAIVSSGSLFAFLKPTGISGNDGAIANATADFGLGTKNVDVTPIKVDPQAGPEEVVVAPPVVQ